MIKVNALSAGEGFDAATGEVIRHDRGLKRMMRGFFAGKWYINVFNIFYMLGAFALAGLVSNVPRSYGCGLKANAGSGCVRCY